MVINHFQHIRSYVRMLSCCSHVWLFATLWTVAHQAPLSMGFSRQENKISCRRSSQSRIEHASPELQGDSLPLSHQRSPEIMEELTEIQSLPFNSLLVKSASPGRMSDIASQAPFQNYWMKTCILTRSKKKKNQKTRSPSDLQYIDIWEALTTY